MTSDHRVVKGYAGDPDSAGIVPAGERNVVVIPLCGDSDIGCHSACDIPAPAEILCGGNYQQRRKGLV